MPICENFQIELADRAHFARVLQNGVDRAQAKMPFGQRYSGNRFDDRIRVNWNGSL
jgi:hypothetical protein